mmetsp:Transcript_8059/g.23665  ORF Transcript_8059/g.23665 Transcript_8059/m.23665 type:complete len:417 (-) Transcript_8059:189-1439(-)
MNFLGREPYMPPAWCDTLRDPPTTRVHLRTGPSPVHAWRPACIARAAASAGVPCLELWIVRDDMNAGVELSGNKVRQLELLLADAIEKGADCIVTTGAVNSNHCRATAIASRLLGLEPHLVLRVEPAGDSFQDAATQVERCYAGNLFFSHLAGAVVYAGHAKAFAAHGFDKPVQACAENLRTSGRRPYVIPKGGSTRVGVWGYLSAVDELLVHFAGRMPHHIFVAADTAGTTAGLFLGLKLMSEAAEREDVQGEGAICMDSPRGTRAIVHAVTVGANSPAAVRARCAQLAAELGVSIDAADLDTYLRCHDGGREGYARHDPVVAATVAAVAVETGVMLDTTYTAKALMVLTELIASEPDTFAPGRSRVVFWHSGGVLGACGQGEQIFGDAVGELARGGRARVLPLEQLGPGCTATD